MEEQRAEEQQQKEKKKEEKKMTSWQGGEYVTRDEKVEEQQTYKSSFHSFTHRPYHI